MRAIKLAGLVAVLLAPMAMATDGDLYWNVRVATDKAGTAPAPAVVDPAVTANLFLVTSAQVTGDNQGLAGFNMSFGVWDMTAGGTICSYVIPAGTILNPTMGWSNAYGVTMYGGATGKTIKDEGTTGGPGLSTLPNLGIKAPDRTFVSQAGTSLLTYTEGLQVWGVGMDSRKSVLLNPGQQTYDVLWAKINIDNASFVPGHTYRVALNPDGSNPGAAVLKSGVNLESGEELSGVTFSLDAANIHNGYAEFTIFVPEPATMLLLAGAGLLIRRRRA